MVLIENVSSSQASSDTCILLSEYFIGRDLWTFSFSEKPEHF